MIKAGVEYWESQVRATIEEYNREKAEAKNEAEAIIIDKAEVIERARVEAEVKAREEDDTRKQV